LQENPRRFVLFPIQYHGTCIECCQAHGGFVVLKGSRARGSLVA
jgi:hypothetical protein